MDKNQGYSILKAVMLENGRGFALGHKMAGALPWGIIPRPHPPM